MSQQCLWSDHEGAESPRVSKGSLKATELGRPQKAALARFYGRHETMLVGCVATDTRLLVWAI